MQESAVAEGAHTLTKNLHIRRIGPADDAAMADVIRTVMTEFGACGEGYSINDAEVDHMYEAYAGTHAGYFVVVTDGDRVVGGGGVAPLEGADNRAGNNVCELKKMYFLPEARGVGVGRVMLQRCLDLARALGFRQCYLETLGSMRQAQRLYERAGFRRIDGPMGDTGHHRCDVWYLLDL
ncbi:MAG: GNAT family N-acetyltransferase [Gemmatimonadaceae bacterium]